MAPPTQVYPGLEKQAPPALLKFSDNSSLSLHITALKNKASELTPLFLVFHFLIFGHEA